MKGKCKTVHSPEKKIKKKERERREAAVEEEGSLCQMVQANSTSWLESLTGSHPVWVSSKRWGGGIWLQWNNKCRLQRHFLFSECLLLRQLPIWRWMYHTLFLQSWAIWGRKRTSEKAKRTQKRCIERIWYVFEWVIDGQASWGVDMGVHKGFCAIWIVGGVLGINVEEAKGAPWGFRGLSWTRLPWWLSW